MTLRMGDSISLLSIPNGLDVYAGYTGGQWQTYGSLRTAFPGKKYLAIAVFASGVGDCLDIESGDATAADVPGWLSRWKPVFNTTKPVLYTNAGNVQTVINNAGRPRDQYWIWSAHYTNTPHICGPSTCGYPQADGTQWTDHGGLWDESLLNDYFFQGDPPVPRNILPAAALPVQQVNSSNSMTGQWDVILLGADGHPYHLWYKADGSGWHGPEDLTQAG